MLRLSCSVQKYDWGKFGKESTCALLKAAGDPPFFCPSSSSSSSEEQKAFEIDDNQTYAEYWIGTHPNGPSLVCMNDTPPIPLKEYLKAHPSLLGTEAKTPWGEKGELAFMLKVLSIRKALSIQAHPNRPLATQLHTERPDVYKDPNHKPEMAVALSEKFEALCGFRLISDIAKNLQLYPEFTSLLPKEILDKIPECSDDSDEATRKELTKRIFCAYMEVNEGDISRGLSDLENRLKGTSPDSLTALDRLLLRLYEDYPADSGIFAPLLLNYVQTTRGKAFTMLADEPHAYLLGEIIECMACSDNVVRVGLTPKFKDVETLKGMLTYRNSSVELIDGIPTQNINGAQNILYRPNGVEEFQIENISLPNTNDTASFPSLGHPSVLLVLSGSALITQSKQSDDSSVEELGTQSVDVGHTYFIPVGVDLLVKATSGDFFATTGKLNLGV